MQEMRQSGDEVEDADWWREEAQNDRQLAQRHEGYDDSSGDAEMQKNHLRQNKKEIDHEEG